MKTSHGISWTLDSFRGKDSTTETCPTHEIQIAGKGGVCQGIPPTGIPPFCTLGFPQLPDQSFDYLLVDFVARPGRNAEDLPPDLERKHLLRGHQDKVDLRKSKSSDAAEGHGFAEGDTVGINVERSPREHGIGLYSECHSNKKLHKITNDRKN